jgi:hypothetical protein
VIGRRQTEHGSGLGRHRWVVELTFARPSNRRRLLIRTDRRDDTHEGVLALAYCLIQRRLETTPGEISRAAAPAAFGYQML